MKMENPDRQGIRLYVFQIEEAREQNFDYLRAAMIVCMLSA